MKDKCSEPPQQTICATLATINKKMTMRNYLAKTLMIAFLVFGFGCWSSEDYIITGIQFRPSQFDNSDYVEIDTFKTGISFMIKENFELATSLIKNVSLINDCKATSKSYKYNNSIIIDSLNLFFNKDLLYNMDTIKANTNILRNKSISNNSQINIFEIQRGVPHFLIINFNTEFAHKIKIDLNTCIAYLKATTTDNMTFIDSTKIIIDMK